MHSPLIAVVVCVFAQAANAQSVTPTPATVTPQVATATVRTAAASPTHASATAAPARPGGELIKAAAAGTRDDAPPVARESAVHPAHDEDHPRRGSTAMLLAALALMSGIALRRFGGPRE